MKFATAFVLAGILGMSLCGTGCEVSHTETDRPNLLGGQTHEERTTTRNPITGDETVTHKKEVTR
jgi:hypothetical protein